LLNLKSLDKIKSKILKHCVKKASTRVTVVITQKAFAREKKKTEKAFARGKNSNNSFSSQLSNFDYDS